MRGWWRLLMLGTLVAGSVLLPHHAGEARGAIGGYPWPAAGDGYPRLANLDSLASIGQVPDYVRYALVVASPAAASGTPSALSLLKAQDPAARILLFQASDYVPVSDFGGLAIYPGWWLTLAGTTLTSRIDATTTRIPVADAGMIARNLASNPDVLVDGESMQVIGVNTAAHLLRVRRGYRSRATAHRAGARLAAHETPEGYGAWMLNVTAYCPRDPATGRTWSEYLAAVVRARLAHAPWDGVFLDVNNADISYMSGGQIDADNDNRPDGGNGPSGTAWRDGQSRLAHAIHAGDPSALIVGNNGYYGAATSGIEFEHFPHFFPSWAYGQAQYLQLAGPGSTGTASILNPDTGDTGTQNLRVMREGLAAALMGDGYFAYDYGAHGHGQTWWYDEYDNGAGSSLSTAIGRTTSAIPLAAATGKRFTAGDAVFVPNTSGSALDDEQMLITAVKGDILIVHRGYRGTTPQQHAAGTKVMTQAQMAAGSGWLGRPLGPAFEETLSAVSEIRNGAFGQGGSDWLSPWTFQVRAPAAATIRREGVGAAMHGAPARITIKALSGAGGTWSVLLAQGDVRVSAGQPYTLTFHARAAGARALDLVIRQGSWPYTVRSNPRYALTASWRTYTLTGTAPATETDQVMFALAQSRGTVWIGDVRFQQGDPNVWQRRFSNGLVVLNESATTRSVWVGPGYRHILGTQDPALNDGSTVSSVQVPPFDAVFLVRD